jgi:predicted phosphoribosyltransferase
MNSQYAQEVNFANRCDAGRRLAVRLREHRAEHPVVLGLARGGIPVAYEVARDLEAPLDVVVTRKIGAPGHRELAIGAVAPEATFLAEDTIAVLRAPKDYVERAIEVERAAVAERSERYRAGAPEIPIEGRPVILVDDGIATGSTVMAAIESVRQRGAARITVAAPVCAPETVPRLSQLADELVCLETPADFVAVGMWYQDFSPTTDDDVIALLRRARREREANHHPAQVSP